MFLEDLIQKAQRNELEEFEKRLAEEHKVTEALRLQVHPGTITGRELGKPKDDEETVINKHFDDSQAASRKAEKENQDAEREAANQPFPSPPITGSG